MSLLGAQTPFNELDWISLERLAQELARRLGVEIFSTEYIIGDYVRHWLERPEEAPLARYRIVGWPAFDLISLSKACAKAVGDRVPGELMNGQIFRHLKKNLFLDRQGVDDFYRSLGLIVDSTTLTAASSRASWENRDDLVYRAAKDSQGRWYKEKWNGPEAMHEARAKFPNDSALLNPGSTITAQTWHRVKVRLEADRDAE